MSLNILSIVGARPNFIKIAPFMRALQGPQAPARHASHRNAGGSTTCPPCFASRCRRVNHILVHTGQHYDKNMSSAFFEELGIPSPDINLGVGSGAQQEQIERTVEALEPVLAEKKPDWVVVVGDVNATCAGAIAASGLGIKVAHIEAGLRSFDDTMPEEHNRITTDHLSDLLFTPDEIADENLKKEGIAEDKIKRVGNIMIDTLEANRKAAQELDLNAILHSFAIPDCAGDRTTDDRLVNDGFAVLTLHRPSNVDKEDVLTRLVGFFIDELVKEMPLIWTAHPRTRKQLETFGLWERVAQCDGLILLNPVGYREMLRLNMGARLLLTDSGGLQEECCILGTPCITLRPNTERPITLREHGGTCELAGNDIERLRKLFAAMKTRKRQPFRPPLWDGHTAERALEHFRRAETTAEWR